MPRLLTTVTKLIPLALGIMSAVEGMFKKGEDKKEAYIEGITTALAAAEIVMDRDLIDDDKFKMLLGKLADDVVAVNNYIRDWKGGKK